MKLGIMQPYFFPYLGYFQLIHAVDRFFLYDHLDYSRGGWINRNRILVVGRGPSFLSVSIKQPRATKTIRDTELLRWRHRRRTLLRTIDVNYRRAPHYRAVRELLDELFLPGATTLAELNHHSVAGVCRYLGIETEIIADSTPYDALEARLRRPEVGLGEAFPWLELDDPARMVVRALAVCRALAADVFVNPIGGAALYAKDDFARHGIDVFFVRSRPYEYDQRAVPFVPDLSIIDVLMNCGRDGTRSLLGNYELL